MQRIYEWLYPPTHPATMDSKKLEEKKESPSLSPAPVSLPTSSPVATLKTTTSTTIIASLTEKKDASTQTTPFDNWPEDFTVDIAPVVVENEEEELKNLQKQLENVTAKFRATSENLQARQPVEVSDLRRIVESKEAPKKMPCLDLNTEINEKLDFFISQYEKILKLRENLSSIPDLIELCDQCTDLGVKLNEFVTYILSVMQHEKKAEEVKKEGLAEEIIKITDFIVEETLKIRLGTIANLITDLVKRMIPSPEKLLEKNMSFPGDVGVHKLNTVLQKLVITLENFHHVVKTISEQKTKITEKSETSLMNERVLFSPRASKPKKEDVIEAEQQEGLRYTYFT